MGPTKSSHLLLRQRAGVNCPAEIRHLPRQLSTGSTGCESLSNSLLFTRRWCVARWIPVCPECCFNAGPASQTVGQHWHNIARTPRVLLGASSKKILAVHDSNHPTNKRRWSKVGLMLARHLRQRPKIKPTLDQILFQRWNGRRCPTNCAIIFAKARLTGTANTRHWASVGLMLAQRLWR